MEQQTLFDLNEKESETKKISDEIRKLVCKLADIQLEKEWSTPVRLDNSRKAIRFSEGNRKLVTGLYVITHDDKPMYIGMGNLQTRKNLHTMIFRSAGVPHMKTSVTDSPCARKMYNYDPKLQNWKISFLVIDSTIDRSVRDAVMKEMEARLIENLKPLFCTEHMAGK